MIFWQPAFTELVACGRPLKLFRSYSLFFKRPLLVVKSRHTGAMGNRHHAAVDSLDVGQQFFILKEE